MLEIIDYVAVITVGGLGFAVAKHWAQNCSKVVLGDVAQEALV